MNSELTLPTEPETIDTVKLDLSIIVTEANECLKYYIETYKVDSLPYPLNEQVKQEAMKVFLKWNTILF